MELARQVGEFMTWKQVECPFEEDRAILHYLHTAPIFSEDGRDSITLSESLAMSAMSDLAITFHGKTMTYILDIIYNPYCCVYAATLVLSCLAVSLPLSKEQCVLLYQLREEGCRTLWICQQIVSVQVGPFFFNLNINI